VDEGGHLCIGGGDNALLVVRRERALLVNVQTDAADGDVHGALRRLLSGRGDRSELGEHVCSELVGEQCLLQVEPLQLRLQPDVLGRTLGWDSGLLGAERGLFDLRCLAQ